MYIIEKTNSNPRILKSNDDGIYSVIAHTAGNTNLDNVIELVAKANRVISKNIVLERKDGKCTTGGCNEPAYVKIIDWENNWNYYCNNHAIKEINNPIPRDA